jgi:crotonobetainyl-CoA:carnitine CoA-transferase CaiB-like acyl-CoA transferase
MHRPMEGVRILEVAQFTFVPAAGAVLADWGADVIKVEHAVTGDAARALIPAMGLDKLKPGSTFHPMMEGPNRGKRSIGLSLDKPEGREVLAELIRNSDVFLTNFLPGPRSRMKIDLEDVRAINPDIIYVRGSGFGNKGPERDKGGYDSTAFWARGGSASGMLNAGAESALGMPTGAYGDSMGGMTIAGGVAAALFARANTGETSVIDVSLLSVGAWATQFATNHAMLSGGPLPIPKQPKHGSTFNPLSGMYVTSDARWLMLTMLQAERYWAGFVTAVGRPELAADLRFSDGPTIAANAIVGGEIVAGIIASKTFAEWLEILEKVEGQWAVIADPMDVATDVSLVANGYIASVTDSEGNAERIVANPVQFDETPPTITRGPLFAEHTDEILAGLGTSAADVLRLKESGAVR